MNLTPNFLLFEIFINIHVGYAQTSLISIHLFMKLLFGIIEIVFFLMCIM